MDWDVFISHAWEDKEDIAGPLAEALRRKGLRVWYDEFTTDRDGNKEIYVINADGSNQMNLTNSADDKWQPTWVP